MPTRSVTADRERFAFAEIAWRRSLTFNLLAYRGRLPAEIQAKKNRRRHRGPFLSTQSFGGETKSDDPWRSGVVTSKRTGRCHRDNNIIIYITRVTRKRHRGVAHSGRAIMLMRFRRDLTTPWEPFGPHSPRVRTHRRRFGCLPISFLGHPTWTFACASGIIYSSSSSWWVYWALRTILSHNQASLHLSPSKARILRLDPYPNRFTSFFYNEIIIKNILRDTFSRLLLNGNTTRFGSTAAIDVQERRRRPLDQEQKSWNRIWL